MSDSPRNSREAADARRLMIEKYGNVGEVWHCAYWNENYTVLSHNENGTVTVRWADDGRETTHGTRLSRRDYRVSPVPLDQMITPDGSCGECGHVLPGHYMSCPRQP